MAALQQKIDDIKQDIAVIEAKFAVPVGQPSNVTTAEVFELCALKIQLRDLLAIQAAGGTTWVPQGKEVHYK